MITVAGSINMDLVARVPHIPRPGQTVLGGHFARHHGGKGANQAVAAARLGVAVQFFGAVGADAFGDELVDGLRGEGVDVAGIARCAEVASGCALISVDDTGENAIAVLPGANALAPLPPAGWRAQLLVLQLEVPMDVNVAWALAAKAAGVPVLLNAAPMAELPSELLAAVDMLVVNQGELAALVGEVPDALAAAAALGPQRIVVTLGAQGGRAWDHGRVLAWPAHAVEAVDSTGAGDTFVGALAAALTQGQAFEAALQLANVAAALACTAPGARGGMPSLAALETHMRS
jgi:ribokinase